MPTEYDARRPRLPVDLARRVDEARGQVPFNRWVVRALEAALGGAVCQDAGGVPSSEAGSSPSPAPPRTPATDIGCRSYVKPFNPIPKGGKG